MLTIKIIQAPTWGPSPFKGPVLVVVAELKNKVEAELSAGHTVFNGQTIKKQKGGVEPTNQLLLLKKSGENY